MDCGYCGCHFETFKELAEHEKTELHHEQFEACEKLLHECLLCAVKVTSASDIEGHISGRKHKRKLVAMGDLRGLGRV